MVSARTLPSSFSLTGLVVPAGLIRPDDDNETVELNRIVGLIALTGNALVFSREALARWQALLCRISEIILKRGRSGPDHEGLAVGTEYEVKGKLCSKSQSHHTLYWYMVENMSEVQKRISSSKKKKSSKICA